ncbi:MAG: DUF2760 domain-containing protein [Mariniblastus sp.]|nr:DUF2760 domain-containing protein [Mariniblastus sp.]
MGLVAATKAFCKLLFNRELSDSFQQLMDGNLQPKIAQPPVKKAAAPSRPAPTRSDAISLLAALQREARLLDIVNESLDEYSDAQVGSAARDVLRDSGKVIERMFGLEPLTREADGSPMKTPASFDPTEFRLTGNVAGEAPFHGTVTHHGWKATRCEVPQWSGDKSTALIVAPVELEIG